MPRPASHGVSIHLADADICVGEDRRDPEHRKREGDVQKSHADESRDEGDHGELGHRSAGVPDGDPNASPLRMWPSTTPSGNCDRGGQAEGEERDLEVLTRQVPYLVGAANEGLAGSRQPAWWKMKSIRVSEDPEESGGDVEAHNRRLPVRPPPRRQQALGEQQQEVEADRHQGSSAPLRSRCWS